MNIINRIIIRNKIKKCIKQDKTYGYIILKNENQLDKIQKYILKICLKYKELPSIDKYTHTTENIFKNGSKIFLFLPVTYDGVIRGKRAELIDWSDLNCNVDKKILNKILKSYCKK